MKTIIRTTWEDKLDTYSEALKGFEFEEKQKDKYHYYGIIKINSLEELKKLENLIDQELIISFCDNVMYIEIYDDYRE